MNTLKSVLAWLLEPTNWLGPAGILARLGEHVVLSVAVLAVVVALAVPLGAWVGHTRRGQTWLAALTNVSRALPTLGLVSLCALWLGIGLRAPFIALAALALPSVLLATAAGTAAVSPVVVEAARALGHTPLQVWWRVELPLSLPVLLGGIRNAALQVVATATIAAYVADVGLGRFIFTGLKTHDYAQMAGGSLLLIALALVTGAVLSLLSWPVSRWASAAARAGKADAARPASAQRPATPGRRADV